MKHLLLLCLSALAVSAFGDVGYTPQDSPLSAVLLEYGDHSNGPGFVLTCSQAQADIDVLALEEADAMILPMLNLGEVEPCRIETLTLPAHHPAGYVRHRWTDPCREARHVAMNRELVIARNESFRHPLKRC